MTDDIRLKFSFKNHRKRKKLNRLLNLSDSGTDYLINLWISTAENHPNGLLNGMDEIDIALEAGWEGPAEEFVDALLAAGWLEQNHNGSYLLHDWDEHQSYIIHSDRRKLQAKMAAAKRYGNEGLFLALKKRFDAVSMLSANSEDTNSNAPSPSPSPSPSHIKKDQPSADPSNHFKDKAPELEARLKVAAEAIQGLPKRKRFEPFKFIQAMFNKRYHPEAVTEVY
jgi:hypothetical protein